MEFQRCIAILFFLLLYGSSLYGQTRQADLERAINKVVHFDAQVDYEQTPGFIVGVYWEGEEYIFPFGTLKDSLPLQDRQFELGAVSQLLTTELVHQGIQAGHFQLETPIGELLEEFKEIPFLTIGACLRHQSGISPRPTGAGKTERDPQNPYGNLNKEALIQLLLTEPKKDADYQYSTYNFALLGIALEAYYQRSLEEQFQQRMPNAWIGQAPEYPDSLWVEGFGKGGRPVNPWSLDACKGSVGLASDVKTLHALLVNWMQSAVRDPEFYQSQAPTGVRKNTLIAHGWHVLLRKRFPEILLHTGATAGHRAFVAMVPETQTGVFVLSNSPFGLGGVGLTVLGMLNNNWKQ